MTHFDALDKESHWNPTVGAPALLKPPGNTFSCTHASRFKALTLTPQDPQFWHAVVLSLHKNEAFRTHTHHSDAFMYSKDEENHHRATEQSLGKAIQHFCALLPEVHWSAPQIKYSTQKKHLKL